MAGKDTNIGAKHAREARAVLGLEGGAPVNCLVTLTEGQAGLPVIIAALPETIAGCCWRDGDRVVLWVNGNDAAVRQRFTLAHELGHVRCGHDHGMPVDTLETLSGKTTDSREVQANAFAAELLAPAAGVEALLSDEPTLDDVVCIAARYGISTVAALYRLNSLGLTARYEQLEVEIAQGLHAEVWERLAPPPFDDAIARTERLPRLSPALADSGLGALAAGDASTEAVAGAAGCDARQLASGAQTIGL